MLGVNLDAINYFLVIPFYIALFSIGIQLIRLRVKEKAIVKENELLKTELYQEKIKNEQLKNYHSIMRLLRQLPICFREVEKVEAEITQLKNEINTYNASWGWTRDQFGLEEEQTKETVKRLINTNAVVLSLTSGFDIAELVLRKCQSCNLDGEDKEILKTEFLLIYEQSCKKAIEQLHLLNYPLAHSTLIPYELLECTHTIEFLENYVSCLIV